MEFPSLREELDLLEGPSLGDGQPSWTLHDPARHLFFRIDWPTFEVLQRWDLADCDRIAQDIAARTTLSMTAREVESEIQVTIDQNTFICKIDAVFDVAPDDRDLPGKTIEIVDWKTGVPPQGDEEIAERALQLALYRMAYSLRHGIPEDQIAVCLYYVADDVVLRPEVLTIEEVKSKWRGVLESF